MNTPHLRVVEGDIMDKQKALDAALAHIEKHFGKGSVMRLGAHDPSIEFEAVPTGSLGLDIYLNFLARRQTFPRRRDWFLLLNRAPAARWIARRPSRSD